MAATLGPAPAPCHQVVRRLNTCPIKTSLCTFSIPQLLPQLTHRVISLDDAHVALLIDSGRIREAAEIHARNGNMLEAVEILTTSAHSVDHVRPTIEYLLTGLRQSLTFGVLPTPSSIASRLLVIADQLDKSAVTEGEIDEVGHSHSFNWWTYIVVPSACNVQSDPKC